MSFPKEVRLGNAALHKDRSEFVIDHSGMAISTEMPIRILLVDEQTIVREGLRLIIESHSEFKIVGEAGNREDALDVAVREQPHIIVLDPTLEHDITYTIIDDLLAAAKDANIIILTGAKDIDAHRQAISLGARGIVLKQEASQVLIRAIEKVYAGETWIERSSTARLLTEVLSVMRNGKTDPDATKIATLTLREREVVELIAEGLKNKQIAERLFITQATVSHHLTSIFSKLGVSDRLQLMIYAYHHCLSKPNH
jgi:DNA-binding NarL/FixJ family response regulator